MGREGAPPLGVREVDWHGTCRESLFCILNVVYNMEYRGVSRASTVPRNPIGGGGAPSCTALYCWCGRMGALNRVSAYGAKAYKGPIAPLPVLSSAHLAPL